LGNEDLEAGADRDLFGEPVRRRQRGRGRPAHQRTRETVNRVILGLARLWSPAKVAKSIGVDLKTLRKHYFPELEKREAMALMMESVQLARLNDQAEKGNVAAEKELMKALHKGRLEAIDEKVARRHGKSERPRKVGKKEAAAIAAKQVGGKFAPPPSPSLLSPEGNA
jgi:hypothetical protein